MVATIGVYGFDLPSFLTALEGAGMRRVLDVRQRRGCAAREYAWANSRRLQAALADAGIGYRHHPELAADHRAARAAVRGRTPGAAWASARAPSWRRLTSSATPGRSWTAWDLEPIAARMKSEGPAALLCVERDPEACHRSLIAARLATEHGLEVTDLLP